jgi:hypothetical protein
MSQEPELEAMSKVLSALQPLDEAAQLRVVRWAVEKLKLPLIGTSGSAGSGTFEQVVPGPVAMEGGTIPSNAALWAKQNGITPAEIEAVFHIGNGSAELIASQIPGKSNKERVLNCYIVCGALEMLRAGDASFTDKSARALCEAFGCFDTTNHAKYLNDRGNELTGSKEKGWTLTAPGKKRAAALLKEMAAAAN